MNIDIVFVFLVISLCAWFIHMVLHAIHVFVLCFNENTVFILIKLNLSFNK